MMMLRNSRKDVHLQQVTHCLVQNFQLVVGGLIQNISII